MMAARRSLYDILVTTPRQLRTDHRIRFFVYPGQQLRQKTSVTVPM